MEIDETDGSDGHIYIVLKNWRNTEDINHWER